MDKIFPYNQEVEEKINVAKRLFHSFMNGIVSHNMAVLGYKLNYGVSLAHIKEISNQFDNNLLFVQRAWWSNCRELMILSTHLLEKEMSKQPMTQSDLKDWSQQIFNMELCEQFSKNFLSKLIEDPYNKQAITRESGSCYLLKNATAPFDKPLAYITFGNLFLQKQQILCADFLFSQMEEDAYSDSYNVYSAIARCLRAYCRIDAKRVNLFINQLDATKGVGILFIKEEIKTELDYNK